MHIYAEYDRQGEYGKYVEYVKYVEYSRYDKLCKQETGSYWQGSHSCKVFLIITDIYIG